MQETKEEVVADDFEADIEDEETCWNSWVALPAPKTAAVKDEAKSEDEDEDDFIWQEPNDDEAKIHHVSILMMMMHSAHIQQTYRVEHSLLNTNVRSHSMRAML